MWGRLEGFFYTALVATKKKSKIIQDAKAPQKEKRNLV
jgi:hypothetical protein